MQQLLKYDANGALELIELPAIIKVSVSLHHSDPFIVITVHFGM
jgi:hypothetical protein